MELVIFITMLCFSFFSLQTPCTSLQIHLLQSSHEKAKAVQSSPPMLPRKLKFTEEVAVEGNGSAQHSISKTKQKEDVSGKEAYQKEEATMHGSRGTRQEWVEGGPDISQFFTMDYSHVRRRRPIHNKSLPVGP
ncbi:hypothetical protein DITRI_Ditri12bG0014000 [Diplodiscus trichospermus]